MQSTNWLIEQLQVDYPTIHFQAAEEFLWSAKRQTINFDSDAINCTEYTLHELSHALLKHEGYRADIELIKMERDAWEYACTRLAPQYDFVIEDDVVQDNLDTYRDWLHARSKCPECGATGLQTKSQFYRCLACNHSWRVNEARICALRRYSVTTK